MENKFCLKSRKELDEIRKQKAEAKKQVNEISDETVYNAVAKAQDKALESLRKDPDKRNFLRDANKLNNIYNAGLRREWRKGLKYPEDYELGDKDYEPVKDEYEKQLKKRNKIDAFGNEKNESKINEGAGSAVIFEFEKADFNIPRVEDNQVIAEVEDLTLASAYDRREAPNGGFIVFDLDQVKAATIKTYNENDRLVDEPELTVEDIADVKYVSVETMPNLSYSWGWSRIELPKDVVLTWDKYQANYYMPELEVIFTDKAGEEYRVNTVNVDGEYHISEDVYYAYQDLDNYEDEEYDESLTAKKALIKSKTILEEYGEYQGDPNFEEIARQLEYGNTYGSTTYGAKWGEVEINGTPISDLLKTNEVIEWVLYELSYPVRDGHAYYNGLDLLFNNYSYEDTIDHTNEDVIADLVALGFDEDLIREMPVIKDPEYQGDISDERFKEIETWINYDINYKEPEEDEEYNESLSKADKRLTVPNRPRLKSLADDIVDLGVETAKSVGHALTGDIFRKRRKPVKENFTASEALQESRKILGEISDELANRVVNARKLNAIGAVDRYNKIDKEYDADLGKVFKKYSDEEVSAGKANKEFDKVIKKYEPLLDPERKTIRKAEKNQGLMARRKTKTNESKINEEIEGNNLNSKWVIRAWMDNMDSEDGYDEIEFTKIGLIDFINSEEKDYYGDSYDYQAEPIEYDITDEELKIAINDNVFAWVFGDSASVVSIDGKPVNESMFNKYGEEVDPKEWNEKEAKGLNEAKSNKNLSDKGRI